MLSGSKSGFALILVGLLFIAVTNNSNRASTLGLVVGIAIILLGVVRLVRARRDVPPPA